MLVTPNGSRLWRLKYRIDGREKLLSIGAYPAVSIKMARDARDSARGLLAAGLDPSQAKKDARRAEAANLETFRSIADEFLAKKTREGRAAATLSKKTWLLGLANSAIGARPIREITAARDSGPPPQDRRARPA